MLREGEDSGAGSAGTEYHGPVEVSAFRFGGREVRLVRPTDPDRLLEDPGVLDWNRRDDYMPYWAYLWPGAYLLAEAVAREDWPAAIVAGHGGVHLGAPAQVDVLEIGCGLGLAGLVALAGGLRVVFTDYDRAPLEFVTRSAVASGFDAGRYATRLLDWRSLPGERYPVILGADVIYESRLVPLVAGVLSKMLAPGGVGLISSPYRVAAEAFPSAVAAHGLACRAEPITAVDPAGRAISGTIYRVNGPERPCDPPNTIA